MSDVIPINRGNPPMYKIIDGKRVELIDIDAMTAAKRDAYFASAPPPKMHNPDYVGPRCPNCGEPLPTPPQETEK